MVFARHLLFRMMSGKVFFASLRRFVHRTLKHLDTNSHFFPFHLFALSFIYYFFHHSRRLQVIIFLLYNSPFQSSPALFFPFSLFISCIIVTSSQHGRRDCSDCCNALVVEIPSIHACCSLEYWRHLSGEWELMLLGISRVQAALRRCLQLQFFTYVSFNELSCCPTDSFIALCFISSRFYPPSAVARVFWRFINSREERKHE